MPLQVLQGPSAINQCKGTKPVPADAGRTEQGLKAGVKEEEEI